MTTITYVHMYAGLYAEIFLRGANLGYGQKRGGGSFCEVLHPTLARGGGGGGGARMTQGGGGKCPSPPPLKYSPGMYIFVCTFVAIRLGCTYILVIILYICTYIWYFVFLLLCIYTHCTYVHCRGILHRRIFKEDHSSSSCAQS